MTQLAPASASAKASEESGIAALATHAIPSASPSIWAFLRPYIKQYRWLILAALLLNAFHGIAIAFQNMVPKYLLDDVLMAPGLTNAQRYHRAFLLAGAYLLSTIVLRMIVWHIGYRIFTYVRERIVCSLRADFFRHVNHLCIRFHLKHHSGELFSYLFGSPLTQIQSYFQQWTFSVPGATFLLISTLIWVGSWDWILTSIMLLLVIVNVLMVAHIRKRIQKLHSDYQSTEISVSGYVADLLRGSRDVKLYAMEDKVAEDFEERAWQVGQKAYQRDVQSHVENMKPETVGYVCFALLCVVCTWRYVTDHGPLPMDKGITLGMVQAYLGSFISLQWPINTLLAIATQRGAAQASLDRISSVLQTASTTPDPIGFEAELPRQGDIQFFNVHFGYDPDRPVLKDINLTIPYGQKVALVGPSGAGKSTFAQLLLRLYDPDQGAILIGGLNIRHCVGQELRRHFAVVPQDPFIFRTTIGHNLRVARPDASDQDIRNVCEQANAWEFISTLPKGLNTPVGEGGSTLSGGQRQRLAIARALLAQQDFFIFDEATSALDTVSERLIHGALTKAMAGRTAIVIAHRLATVQSCDRILVVRAGMIIQDGTYDALASKPGLFRDLVTTQTLQT